MKKWSYLLSGVLIGAVVATASSAFADQIKSLVGEKVAGEYSVKVNGNSLSENAIVVDGKAHVPLRAVTDSLGANLKLDGKTIQISTDSSTDTKTTSLSETEGVIKKEGQYAGWSIAKLEQRKSDLEKYISESESSKEKLNHELEIADKLSKTSVSSSTLAIRESNVDKTKKELDSIESAIAKYKTELEEINKAIAALK
ncbi:copper amine oxidase N-terminal domain-containing protein [Paenibacillus farraposensis]|uniref:Copper amine oxidase N-terminal domain-containing protein n=1 Tax=Paenibacillus farraposensis TaxID=2807095 RepID=A0ABW4DCS6_9BACL|nr:copper amine oxidase N-terminal domain-containing protein [Paenibacillus farraposensis]MCC3380682.1 2,' 3'-cyclic nucleotide 2'-phosphodiesterase [Paenibacillus farraposensis]